MLQVLGKSLQNGRKISRQFSEATSPKLKIFLKTKSRREESSTFYNLEKKVKHIESEENKAFEHLERKIDKEVEAMSPETIDKWRFFLIQLNSKPLFDFDFSFKIDESGLYKTKKIFFRRSPLPHFLEIFYLMNRNFLIYFSFGILRIGFHSLSAFFKKEYFTFFMTEHLVERMRFLFQISHIEKYGLKNNNVFFMNKINWNKMVFEE